jgi:hypothetical protein
MTDLRHRRQEMRVTTNPTVYWKARRNLVLSCGYCRPHHMENHGRRTMTNRYKDIRKGRDMKIRTIRDSRVWRLFALPL